MAKKKLFLLDAFALIYRAHFAFIKAPRVTSYGLNTSCVLGFVNTLLDVLKNERPTHIAIAFDTAAPTERHTDFTDYKANRQEMPEDIKLGLPYIFEIIEAFNIPILKAEGYEADDIIGTVAKHAEKEGFEVFCMTPDKDYAQLVSENIFLYKPGRAGGEVEIMGVPEVLAKWEIDKVEQVIDILGLWGDVVDNIPGIPGVGEKTAKTLIKQYGSMENIIANSHELKGKLKENVEQFAEQGLVSKRLATIILDVPCDYTLDSFAIEKPNNENLEKIFQKLEFKTLGKRLLGDNFEIEGGKAQQTNLFGEPVGSPVSNTPLELDETLSSMNSIENTKHSYTLVQDAKDIQALIDKLSKSSAFCFDIESTGIDAHTATAIGLAFSTKAHEGYYVPVYKKPEVLEQFRSVFENPSITKIGQNIKYDITILKWAGIEVQGALFDTMIAHYLIDADSRHGMDVLSETYLNYKPISITELIGAKGKNQGNMKDVPVEKVSDYAAEDADITFQLYETFKPLIKDIEAEPLFHQVENPLIYVLSDMEKEGVLIDKEVLHTYSGQLESDIKTLEKAIFEKSGAKFNLNSPKQLGEVLFEVLKLDDKAKKTKTGQYKTDEDILSKLAQTHEVPQLVMDYRQLQKLKSTYVDALPTMINPNTGRVHTNFRQAVAATGRLSSDGPNLQNIPIKTERGREVRKAFIPRPGNLLLSADYSQIELRIIAHLSNDAAMIEAFKNKIDIHTATASKVYQVPLEEVDGTMRRNAKAVNFGIIYGQSAFGLSQSLGISRTEAKEIIDSYFTQFAGLKTYMDNIMNVAREQGYVETILGRRRYLRDINSANQTVRGFAERNAINAPVQGSAADMIKKAMIDIHAAMKKEKLQSKMILQVHDELVFEVVEKEMDIMKKMIPELMENTMKLNVPIVAEVGTGLNWLEAH
jgi:DNA polymerase I